MRPSRVAPPRQRDAPAAAGSDGGPMPFLGKREGGVGLSCCPRPSPAPSVSRPIGLRPQLTSAPVAPHAARARSQGLTGCAQRLPVKGRWG